VQAIAPVHHQPIEQAIDTADLFEQCRIAIDVARPGRIGAAQTNAPYVNPYGAGALCDKYCTPADYPYARDGYKACAGWNRAVTIWRK
jgi:hypothetical protein